MKTGTANLISFSQKASDTTSTGSVDVPANPFDNPEYEEHLKGIVESAVLEAWMKARILDIEKVDDPFDAIYLAELPPDNIYNDNLDRINRFTSIEDLSDTINFDDGWDD
jgi:hypothetical protein